MPIKDINYTIHSRTLLAAALLFLIAGCDSHAPEALSGDVSFHLHHAVDTAPLALNQMTFNSAAGHRPGGFSQGAGRPRLHRQQCT